MQLLTNARGGGHLANLVMASALLVCAAVDALGVPVPYLLICAASLAEGFAVAFFRHAVHLDVVTGIVNAAFGFAFVMLYRKLDVHSQQELMDFIEML